MKPTRIMIVAVGGQGNILSARMLGEASIAADIDIRMSEFHGMAQRGGVVESMVLLGPGKSYCISDGQADILVGFEPSETLRAAGKCSPQTLIITNTAPLPPSTVALGQSRYPDVPGTLLTLSARVKKLIAFDATALALQAGSAVALNMVMLGALAGSNALCLPSSLLKQAITKKTKKQFVDINLNAFELGRQAAAGLILSNGTTDTGMQNGNNIHGP